MTVIGRTVNKSSRIVAAPVRGADEELSRTNRLNQPRGLRHLRLITDQSKQEMSYLMNAPDAPREVKSQQGVTGRRPLVSQLRACACEGRSLAPAQRRAPGHHLPMRTVLWGVNMVGAAPILPALTAC